jgi:hypothetical protein
MFFNQDPEGGRKMKETRLTLPQLWMIAATRAVLGGGFALLFADRLSDRERKLAGWALFLAGAASTVPLAKLVFDKLRAGEDLQP